MNKHSRNSKLTLAQERELLLRRSILLREQIASQSRQLVPVTRTADSAFNVLAWVKANPGLVLGVLGSLVLLRPRRTVRMGFRAWGLWRMASRFMPLIKLVNRLR